MQGNIAQVWANALMLATHGMLRRGDLTKQGTCCTDVQ
jgi:hypothetical protein